MVHSHGKRGKDAVAKRIIGVTTGFDYYRSAKPYGNALNGGKKNYFSPILRSSCCFFLLSFPPVSHRSVVSVSFGTSHPGITEP